MSDLIQPASNRFLSILFTANPWAAKNGCVSSGEYDGKHYSIEIQPIDLEDQNK